MQRHPDRHEDDYLQEEPEEERDDADQEDEGNAGLEALWNISNKRISHRNLKFENLKIIQKSAAFYLRM